MSITAPRYQWIATSAELDAACHEVASAEVIALDTEFFRERTFYPLPALIQFASRDVAYLVDPVAVACTKAFRELLENSAIKLLHACSEDLDVFQRWAGTLPTPLVDTQVAQAFLSTAPGVGYQKLVEIWTYEVLPKEETRSDWLKRPLSDGQCRYAALDVLYLLKIWACQAPALDALGRLQWVFDESRSLVEAARLHHADQWFLRQRQLWRLSPLQIEAYRQLTIWRETEIRKRDLPRNWLVGDQVLLAIATQMPTNRYQLAAVDGVKPSLVNKEGDSLLAMIESARHCPVDALPLTQPDPSKPPFKPLANAAKKEVAKVADALGVAPEVVLRRRQLDRLVLQALAGAPLDLPAGWRGDYLAGPLERALKDTNSDNTSS